MVNTADTAVNPAPELPQHKAARLIAVLSCKQRCTRDEIDSEDEDKLEHVKREDLSEEELDVLSHETLIELVWAYLTNWYGGHRRCKPSCRPGFIEKLIGLQGLLKNVTKLDAENWHTWNDHFLCVMRCWTNALITLEGKIRPDDPHFDKQLDRHLVVLLRGCIDQEGQNSIKYLVQRPKDLPQGTSNELYEHL